MIVRLRNLFLPDYLSGEEDEDEKQETFSVMSSQHHSDVVVDQHHQEEKETHYEDVLPTMADTKFDPPQVPTPEQLKEQKICTTCKNKLPPARRGFVCGPCCFKEKKCLWCEGTKSETLKIHDMITGKAYFHEDCLTRFSTHFRICRMCFVQGLPDLTHGTVCAKCCFKHRCCRWCKTKILDDCSDARKYVFQNSYSPVFLHHGECVANYCIYIKQCRFCCCFLTDIDGSACAACCERNMICRWCKEDVTSGNYGVLKIKGTTVYVHKGSCAQSYYFTREICIYEGCSEWHGGGGNLYCPRHKCNVTHCKKSKEDGIAHCWEHLYHVVVPNMPPGSLKFS